MEEMPSPLQWHDLQAHEVYYLAHAEHEVREVVATTLGRVAFMSDSLQRADALESAERLLAHHEARAASWFADQAAIKGLAPVGTHELTISQPAAKEPQHPYTLDTWLGDQFNRHPMSTRQMAALSGVSHAHIHDLSRGRHRAGVGTVKKIAEAFAELEGLSGDERQAFISSALRAAGFPHVQPQSQ